MIKCTKCDREFKTPQALGGHMRGAHQEVTQEEIDPNHAAGNPKTLDEGEETCSGPGSWPAFVPQLSSFNPHSRRRRTCR